MTAALIAEALAAGVANTPENGWPEKFYVIFDDGGSLWTDELIENPTAKDGSVDECVMIRAEVVEAALAHLATRLERVEARAAELSAAMAAVFEIAAGCDGPEFEAVFSIAHDACKTCGGCFAEGKGRVLVPAAVAWHAERRAEAAEAAIREGWRACVLLAAMEEARAADDICDEALETSSQEEHDGLCAEASRHFERSARLRAYAAEAQP